MFGDGRTPWRLEQRWLAQRDGVLAPSEGCRSSLYSISLFSPLSALLAHCPSWPSFRPAARRPVRALPLFLLNGSLLVVLVKTHISQRLLQSGPAPNANGAVIRTGRVVVARGSEGQRANGTVVTLVAR